MITFMSICASYYFCEFCDFLHDFNCIIAEKILTVPYSGPYSR